MMQNKHSVTNQQIHLHLLHLLCVSLLKTRTSAAIRSFTVFIEPADFVAWHKRRPSEVSHFSWTQQNQMCSAELTGGMFGSTCGSSLRCAASSMCFTASILNPSTPFSSQKRIRSYNLKKYSYRTSVCIMSLLHFLIDWVEMFRNSEFFLMLHSELCSATVKNTHWLTGVS